MEIPYEPESTLVGMRIKDIKVCEGEEITYQFKIGSEMCEEYTLTCEDTPECHCGNTNLFAVQATGTTPDGCCAVTIMGGFVDTLVEASNCPTAVYINGEPFIYKHDLILNRFSARTCGNDPISYHFTVNGVDCPTQYISCD